MAEFLPNVHSVSDLADLVAHRTAVRPSLTVSQVYDLFQRQPHEFLAVTDEGLVVGVVSRGHVGFLLGGRFGFAIFGRQSIGLHLLPRYLAVSQSTPLLEVFSAALSREGDYFYEDVVLVDEAGIFCGMIPVPTLVQLQTRLITKQIHLAERQQVELQEKNQQLFRHVNELRQSRGRYEILFKNSALGVLLLDRHGLIETCNERLEHLLGMEIPAAAGPASLTDLISGGDRERFLDLLHQLETLPAAAAPAGGEFTLALPGRGPRLFKFFLSWIQETGQICALVDDITEQRVLERRLQQKEKSVLLESLVGGIAHEINNKLSPIMGFAELVANEVRNVPSTRDLRRYCQIIRDSAMESASIIRQLLQLSRPGKAEFTRCDLKQMVQDAVELLRFRLRELDCQLQLSLPPHECPMQADAAQFKQVILNLILNAADAMEGRPQRRLHVRIIVSGKHYHLLVADTGHGIKPEHLPRIFDPFFTTKAPDRGTGLGLSVCFSAVKQHEGDISVSETSPQGTTFKVTLPAGEVAPALPAPHALLSAGADQAFHDCRVLIADDEEFVSGMVQEVLRTNLGCQIDKALDGAKAIEWINKTEYDLILSDVRMPKLDGFGLLDWVKNHRPALAARFIFMTGDAGSAELNRKLETADLTVLRKPFDIETLLQTCRRILRPAAAPASHLVPPGPAGQIPVPGAMPEILSASPSVKCPQLAASSRPADQLFPA
jgi:signal transduction histidine kinase/CheY-like chemotaxis protein